MYFQIQLSLSRTQIAPLPIFTNDNSKTHSSDISTNAPIAQKTVDNYSMQVDYNSGSDPSEPTTQSLITPDRIDDVDELQKLPDNSDNSPSSTTKTQGKPTTSSNSDNESERNKKTTKISSKSKLSTSLTKLTICCLLILPILGSNFEVHPGIYYDGVGEVNLISNNWHLITHYNMTTYWQNAQQLNFLSNRAKALCKQTVCKESIKQLNIHLQDITIMNGLIKKECQLTEFQGTIQVDSLSIRPKRGAIDVIGT